VCQHQEPESVSAPVPTVGLRERAALANFLVLIARPGYLGYDGNSFLDVDSQVEFSPLSFVGLFAGYRYLEIDIDDRGFFINTSINGPYAGALIRFYLKKSIDGGLVKKVL
jgi:hypothetical protein